MTGNVMLQLEKGVKKIFMDLAKVLYIHTGCIPTNRCDDSQGEHFGKVVLGRIALTGVFQVLKNLDDPRSHGVGRDQLV